MANTPKPRLLPRVTYSPPSDPPSSNQRGGSGSLWGDIQNAAAPYTQSIYDALNSGGDYLFGSGKVARPDPNNPYAPKVGLGTDSPWGASVDAPSQQVSGSVTVLPNGRGGAGVNGSPTPTGTDLRGMQGGPQGGQNYGQPPSNTAGTVPQSALTNNRTNLANAQASGDTANIARLQAEWERIAPLAQEWGITPQRLVGSYMQDPKVNPAAKNSLGEALAAARADDHWGDEATQAFGRPPNQQEWDEHWRAMNVGGRDPLEGHPQAVQNLIARAAADRAAASQAGEYQQWVAGQK